MQVAADVAAWIGDRLGDACYCERGELPAGVSSEASGPVATITLEDGSRLVVTVAVEH
jgi:hypothetical protein